MRRHSFQDRIYDDGFWFTVLHPFICPSCGGESGYYGYGSEPDEPCNFCKDRGYVGLWAKVLTLHDWFIGDIISNIRYAREQREHKEKK